MHGILRRSRLFCFPRLAQLGVALLLGFGVACAEDPGAAQAESPAAAQREPRADGAPRVILISLDGIRHDYLDREGLPAFARLASEGAAAKRLLPVFPSITFPTHVSLATGAYPDVHGIVGNRFWDSERGEEYDYSAEANWLEAEPIWIAAERQGIPAAVFFWVGSETDWRGRGATHRKTPFSSKISERKKVDQILEWFDMPTSDPDRPGLIMAYWRGTDHAAHRHGPDSANVDEALQQQDRELGRLLAELDARKAWSTTTLLVVSDHGMIEAGRHLSVKRILRAAGIRARTVHAGAVAHVHLENPNDVERALKTLEAQDGVRAFASSALPDDLRYAHSSRTGDVVALTEPPYVFSSVTSSVGARLLEATGNRPGMHGYDVREVPEMAGILLATGRGVSARAALGDVRAIDVAATVAELLEIDPPAKSEGQPIVLEVP
ncbi:MAG: ectonucleotide pyrophosphatase/phosphodiesterase [Myxococcota bacterium]|nr:ectonucleotide pyrophosphatase/phosphodiesterase [Myxococcota bacterium]